MDTRYAWVSLKIYPSFSVTGIQAVLYYIQFDLHALAVMFINKYAGEEEIKPRFQSIVKLWQWSCVNNSYVSGSVNLGFEGNKIITCIIFTINMFAGSRPMIIHSIHRYTKSGQDVFKRQEGLRHTVLKCFPSIWHLKLLEISESLTEVKHLFIIYGITEKKISTTDRMKKRMNVYKAKYMLEFINSTLNV